MQAVQSHMEFLPISVPDGIVLAVTVLCLDPIRLREAPNRHGGTAP